MKKIHMLLLAVLLVSQILTGCSQHSQEIDYENMDYHVTLSIELKYDEKIFKGFSREETRGIFDAIMDEVLLTDDIEYVAKDKLEKIVNPHEVNADIIIERVLNAYGLSDRDLIELAQDKMIIKKIKRN